MWIAVTGAALSQSSTCFESDPFCTGTNYEFPASVNAGDAEPGPDYGCLGSQPNPVWYHMRIQVPGDIIIDMYSEPLNDIDFICWGPFEDPHEPCLDQLTGDKIMDCSYSGSAQETCNITNSQTGEYYILMITNFSNQPCNINFSQSGGDGATDCGILPGQITSNSPVCEGDTLFISANTVSGAEYFWEGPNSFESNDQHLVFPDATAEQEGEYELVVQVDDEVSEPVYTDVIVDPVPVMSAGEDKSIPFGTFVELDGSVEGSPSEYSFLWTPVDMLQEATLLAPATVNLEESVEYTFKATEDATGCFSEDEAVVTVTGGALGVSVNSASGEICFGDQIQLKAQTSGGSGEYTYSWTSDPEGFSSDIYNPTVVPQQTTTYFVEVSDGFNTVDGQITIAVNELPQTSAGEDKTIPFGTSTTLESTTSGGGGSYSYVWSDATFLVDENAANPQTTNLYDPTTFSLVVTDDNGCESNTDQILVSLSGGPLTAVPSVEDNSICFGDETTLHAAASGGSEQYSYSWSEDGEILSTDIELSVNPSATTTYELTVDDGFNQSTKPVTVSVNPLPDINLVPDGYSSENDTMMACVYDTIQLDASSGIQAEYLWDNGSVEAVKTAKTSGISFDLQTHEVEVTNTQTGCVKENRLTIVFTFAQCTSIEELSRKGISIYPVPADQNLVVELEDHPGKTTITIRSLFGQIILHETISSDANDIRKKTLNVKDFPAGVYVVTIENNRINTSAKIIIE